MARTCIANQRYGPSVTYLCIGLLLESKHLKKQQKLKVLRKRHFGVNGWRETGKVNTCEFCEVLWDLAIEYRVKNRLQKLLDENFSIEYGMTSEQRRVYIKDLIEPGKKRQSVVVVTSFLAKVPKEKFMPVLLAACST